MLVPFGLSCKEMHEFELFLSIFLFGRRVTVNTEQNHVNGIVYVGACATKNAAGKHPIQDVNQPTSGARYQ